MLAVGLVALMGLGSTWYANYEPWRPLAGGAEVRLEKAHYGDVLTVLEPGVQLDWLRERLGPTFNEMLGPYPGGFSAGGGISFEIVFFCRGPGYLSVLDDAKCEIDLPNGQVLQGDFGGGGGSATCSIEPASFTIVPTSEPRLNVRLEVGGETLRYTLRNPAYVANRPQWKADSLPQTRTVDGFEFTLERVVSEWADDRWPPGSPWDIRADFSVRTEGKDVTQWVRCTPTICDPLGNEAPSGIFGDPVWKLRCTAVRRGAYPYRDAEVTWLGPTTLPGPGEAHIIARKPGVPSTTPSLLAMLGPGRYLVAADKGTIIVMTGPGRPDRDGSPIFRYYPDKTIAGGGGEHSEVTTTAIELFSINSTSLSGGQEGGAPDLFMRDDKGRRLPLTERYSSAGTTLYTAPLAAEIREVEVGLVEVHEMKSEFFIQPPQPPSEAARPKNGSSTPANAATPHE